MTSTLIKFKFFLSVLIFFICTVLISCQPLLLNNPQTNPIATSTATPTNNAVPTQTSNPIVTLTTSTQLIKVDPSQIQNLNFEVWYSWLGETKLAFEDLVKTFNQNNPWGIIVNPVYKGSTDLLRTDIRDGIDKTGKLPNLAITYNFEINSWINNRNIFVNYDDYLLDSTWGMSEFEKQNPYTTFIESDQYLGKQWAIPAWRDARLLFYNQSWAEELGFSLPPTSLDDFYEQSCVSANENRSDNDDENDGTGGWIIDTNFLTSLSWIKSSGGDILDSNEKKYQFQSPEVTETFQFLRKLYENKCSWISESSLPVGGFATRKGLFMTGNLSDIPFITRELKQANNSDIWKIIPFPTKNNTSIITIYGQSFALFKKTEAEQLAAWLFIKYVLSPENHARLSTAESSLPLSLEEANLLKNQSTNQNWLTSFDLLPYAVSEPNLPSWANVRWALGDATTQLYQWYFKSEQIPDLVKLLDQTANTLDEKTE